MILTLFFACILPGKELVGDSDRPFDPSEEQFDTESELDPETENWDGGEDSGNGEDDTTLFAYADGTDIYVEHYDVHLPCDFDSSEINTTINPEEFLVTVVYSEREPENCYEDLSYTINFEGSPAGTYTLEAHGDDTTFDYQ